MRQIPVAWASMPDWMRMVATAINPLIRQWPSLTVAGSLGYETGAGGVVTQATSKTTPVTLHRACGEITLNGASLAAGATATFSLTNSNLAAGDVLILNHVTTGTFGAYALNARCGAGTASIDVTNRSGGALAEAIVIRFALLKGVTS